MMPQQWLKNLAKRLLQTVELSIQGYRKSHRSGWTCGNVRSMLAGTDESPGNLKSSKAVASRHTAEWEV